MIASGYLPSVNVFMGWCGWIGVSAVSSSLIEKMDGMNNASAFEGVVFFIFIFFWNGGRGKGEGGGGIAVR